MGLILQVIGAAIASIIVALIVRWACSGIARFKPEYGNAYRATFFAAVLGIAVIAVLDLVLPDTGFAMWSMNFNGLGNEAANMADASAAESPSLLIALLVALLTIGIPFLVDIAVYQRVIAGPNGERLSLGDAALVATFKVIFFCTVFFVLWVGLMFLFASMMVSLLMAGAG